MAYNLRSLAYSINQILHPVPQFDSVHKSEKEKLESLLEKVNTLQQILENLPLPTYNRLEILQRQVIHLSHRAEDIVDSAFVDLVSVRHRVAKPLTVVTFLEDLQNVIEEFDSLINKVPTMVDSSQRQTVIDKLEDLMVVGPNPESSSSAAGGCARISSSCSSLKTSEDAADPPARITKGVAGSQTCWGLEEDMNKLKHWLIRYDEPALEVIGIVGMGGIGKTTLTQKLYDDHYVVNHYDCRAWVTISQEYEVGTLISTLLSCLPKIQSEKDTPSVKLHKTLYNRRYLIVLDDIWSTTVLDELSAFFPDNGNNSTIILTTRHQEVAAACATLSRLHNMHFLGPLDSWNLFCAKAFGTRKCLNPTLERLGRYIVRSCKGLPLAISVISAILLECDNTEGLWEHVATVAALKDDHLTKILSLSYDHLPHHLRPCLLYLGALSKGADIRVSKIKRLWAAESFLKPIEGKTPEEAAEQYLEDLKNRNLLVVRKMKSCGKVKSYSMHDLLKDLCVTRAAQEDFVVYNEHGHAVKAPDRSIKAQSLRRALFHEKRIKFIYHSVCELLSTSNLLRVLDLPEEFLSDHFPEEILQLVNIRYLSLSCKLLPPSLSRLWNLETFIIFCNYQSEDVEIPDEMWELQKLKHFKIIGEVIGMVELHFALGTLQTLSIVRGKQSVANLIEKIPSIKELGMDLCEHDNSQDIDLSNLYNLENLKMRKVSQSLIGFPSSVAKMTLFWCYMDENSMKVIGELTGLKVLKLQDCGWIHLADEKEWKTYGDGFPSLHFLQLGILNLRNWNTEDEAHFPVLRHLLVRGCNFLEEIPSCIGDIPTLEIIEIERSSSSAVESARRIQNEQRDMINVALQVRIKDYEDDPEEEEFDDDEEM